MTGVGVVEEGDGVADLGVIQSALYAEGSLAYGGDGKLDRKVLIPR
jgi:hypothetical protein